VHSKRPHSLAVPSVVMIHADAYNITAYNDTDKWITWKGPSFFHRQWDNRGPMSQITRNNITTTKSTLRVELMLNFPVYNYAKFATYKVDGCPDQVELCLSTNITSLADYAICTEGENICRDNVEGPIMTTEVVEL